MLLTSMSSGFQYLKTSFCFSRLEDKWVLANSFWSVYIAFLRQGLMQPGWPGIFSDSEHSLDLLPFLPPTFQVLGLQACANISGFLKNNFSYLELYFTRHLPTNINVCMLPFSYQTNHRKKKFYATSMPTQNYILLKNYIHLIFLFVFVFSDLTFTCEGKLYSVLFALLPQVTSSFMPACQKAQHIPILKTNRIPHYLKYSMAFLIRCL